MTSSSLPAQNLAAVLETIAKTARQVEREPEDVTLVAVSKRQPGDRVDALLAAGHRVFGENRVQEAQARWSERRTTHRDVKLHLVGPLQSNKARDAVALFDVIETLDRPSLAAALRSAIDASDRPAPQLYVQVNTGQEPQKAGVAPHDAPAFIDACRTEFGLQIDGLMCIPPVDEEPALHFALLADLARRCEAPLLSMGMSGDYETAVRFGATSVRVGSALFGPRDAG